MKRMLLTSAILSFAILTRAQDILKKPKQSKKDPRVFYLTKNTDNYYSNTDIDFSLKSDLIARLQKEKDLKMWSEEKYQAELKSIPDGGYLSLVVHRLTIGAADMKYFSIIIKDTAGQEILREENITHSGAPDYTDKYWYSYGLAILPEELPSTFTVFVVDALDKKRFQFLVKI